jgi:hypothetical protein
VKKISTEVKAANFRSLFKESDKGTVLLVGAIFDKILENIIEAAIVANLTGDNPTNKFFKEKILTSNGLLFSFDRKITIAYSFKLITPDHYKAIDAIRELRNEAAHCIFDYSLNNKGVSAHLKQLQKYTEKIGQKQLMNFESLLPEVQTDEDMIKLNFIVTSYEFYLELNDILGDQLERILTKRATLKAKEEKKKPFHIPSGEFTIKELEKANPELDPIALRLRLSDSFESGEIVNLGKKLFKKPQ